MSEGCENGERERGMGEWRTRARDGEWRTRARDGEWRTRARDGVVDTDSDVGSDQ